MTAGYFTGPGWSGSGNVSHQQFQVPCPPGSYCSGGVRYDCPGGRYGATSTLQDRGCTGGCDAGYYCPPNSTSPQQWPCGNVSVYCGPGSASPAVAIGGEHTVGPDERTRNGTAACASGSYCVNGTSRLCPGGYFGCADRLDSALCNGQCNAGYYCSAGSVSNQQHTCGGNASSPNASAVYCPVGSPQPVRVDVGYYSTGSSDANPHIRSGQAQCPVGTYCVGGTMVRDSGERERTF